MRFIRNYWLPVTLSAVGVLFSFFIQSHHGFWSPMTTGEEDWLKKIDMHLRLYPYNIRPFQNYSTLWLHRLTSLPIRESFFAIQFTLAMILGPVFYSYLKGLKFDRKWSAVGVVLLFTAYPIFGAHYAPTHTWDDFWGYLFITLSMILLLGKRPILAGLLLTIAVIAREHYLIFFPVVMLGIWTLRREYPRWKLVLSLVLPLILAVTFRVVVAQHEDIRRLTFLTEYNFQNLSRTVDSLSSLVIAFGYLWLFSLIGLFKTFREKEQVHRGILLTGYIITVPITVALAVVAAYTRETRILFPPFIFVIPLSLIAIRSLALRLRQHWSGAFIFIFVSLLIGFTYVGMQYPGHWLYTHFDYKANADLRGPLAGGYAGAMVAILVMYVADYLRTRIFTSKAPSPPIRPEPLAE